MISSEKRFPLEIATPELKYGDKVTAAGSSPAVPKCKEGGNDVHMIQISVILGGLVSGVRYPSVPAVANAAYSHRAANA